MVSIEKKLQQDSKPWWKYGYVWMFIAGPAAVVLAGFYTFWLAVTIPDPVVAQDYYQQGLDINKTLADKKNAALAPALKGRNHAATPLHDRPEK
jgi:hypothetical protein